MSASRNAKSPNIGFEIPSLVYGKLNDEEGRFKE